MNRFGSQSALDPAGTGAERIATLFFSMSVGAVVIWCVVIGVAVYALLRPSRHPAKETYLLVIGGGALFPTIVLSGLIAYGLSLMPEIHAPAATDSQRIRVKGVRWWWRVDYVDQQSAIFTTANEIWVPIDEDVQFELLTEDVIHSFWIPSFGGKMDMIPGRVNRLKLHPSRPGHYRGVCAEFCGAAHAEMAFDVVAVPRNEFDLWLEKQRSPARPADTEELQAGLDVFLKYGCDACHAIRGTLADGVVGPDLTHFGSRISIGAGTLANNPDNLTQWIRNSHRIKPGVNMPEFRTIDEPDLTALVAYLEHLH